MMDFFSRAWAGRRNPLAQAMMWVAAAHVAVGALAVIFG